LGELQGQINRLVADNKALQERNDAIQKNGFFGDEGEGGYGEGPPPPPQTTQQTSF